MITVHHLENSRSQRILWLLEELGIPYEVKRYQRDRKTSLAPPELKAVHPLGKSPVISDGSTVVAESGLIVEYLIETYGKGKLIPAEGTPERLRYRYWLHYAEGSFMPLMVMTLIFSKLAPGSPALIRPLVKAIVGKVHAAFLGPQTRLHLDYLEGELAKSEWFAGNDISGADIQMSFPLEAAAARGGLDQTHPRLATMLKKMQARPAYQRALERGGPYQLMR